MDVAAGTQPSHREAAGLAPRTSLALAVRRQEGVSPASQITTPRPASRRGRGGTGLQPLTGPRVVSFCGLRPTGCAHTRPPLTGRDSVLQQGTHKPYLRAKAGPISRCPSSLCRGCADTSSALPAGPARARDHADQGHSAELKEPVSRPSPLGLGPQGQATCDPAVRETSRLVGYVA